MNLGAKNNRFDTIFCENLDVENGVMGGGSNVTQTVIGSESDWLTEGNTTKTIALTDDIDNYDYLVFVLEFRRGTSTSYENRTVLARVGYTNTINVDHSIGTDDGNGNYIINVSISASGTGASIYQGARGSAYSGARIKEVIGIKLTKNLDNATSLDETLLYSGSDKVTSINATNSYTMADTIDNYNYLLVTIKAYRTGVEDATTIIIKDEDKYYSWEINYSGNFDPSRFSVAGFVHIVNDTLEFGLRYRGSSISYAYISSVIGIKKKSLSTADIAELSMPSSVYTTLTVDSSGNVIAPANGYLQVIYDIVINNITSVGLDDYVVLIPAGFNGATDCGTELYPVSKGKTTKLNIAAVLSGHYTVKFIYSVGDAKALGLL